MCSVDVKTKMLPALRVNPVLQLSIAKPEYIKHLSSLSRLFGWVLDWLKSAINFIKLLGFGPFEFVYKAFCDREQ